jgi:hypothetical protein
MAPSSTRQRPSPPAADTTAAQSISRPRKAPPRVDVRTDEVLINVRAWARSYVHLLCSIEGIALMPSTMERAS